MSQRITHRNLNCTQVVLNMRDAAAIHTAPLAVKPRWHAGKPWCRDLQTIKR